MQTYIGVDCLSLVMSCSSPPGGDGAHLHKGKFMPGFPAHKGKAEISSCNW